MSKTLSFALVLSAGSIDREQSLKSASDALDAHIAEHETQQETIAQAVSSVFDQYPGANLTMPTIEGMTLRALNAQPSNYKVLGKLVLDYVRANADQKDEAERTRTFGISKGKNGGVCRWSDVPEKTEAPAAAE
jgi:hypothetical protein